MNINVPVSSNHPHSYAIIQNSPAPILTAASTPAAPLQQAQPSLVGGGDVHICGSCGSQYTDIKEFINHKQQGCQSSESIATISETLQPQITHPPVHHASPSPHGSVQVGMPHVILHAPSGPPQMYRIVLEPSVTSPSTQGQSILAQALTGAQIPQVSQSPPQHTQLDSLHVADDHQQQTIVSTDVETGPTNSEAISSEGLIQLSNVNGSWQTHSEESGNIASTVRVEEGRVGSNDSTPVTTSDGGATRIDLTATDTSMHTEEEDVATFLATQLASQAAPHQTSSVVSEQMMSNVVSGVQGTDAHIQYTSAPTQSHQSSRQQVVGRQRQQPPGTSIPSGSKTSPATRRVTKGLVVDKGQNRSKVTVKTEKDLEDVKKAEILVIDGIEKEQCSSSDREKFCPFKGCNFVTARNKDRNRHIRKHTGEKPYRCEVCGSCFSRSDKMKVHMRIHTNVKPYACQVPQCGYRSIDSGSLKKHMRKHTNERPYSCQLCSYAAKESSQLTVHLRTHTGDTPFQCMVESCSAAFKTSSDLRRHERLHTGVKPHQCAICDYACSIKSNLTVHMKLNHFQGARFGCTKCDFQGNSRKHLKDHEKTHSEAAFCCGLCDYVSTTTASLGQHMLIHSQDKPFQCRYCSFTCKRTGNLRTHLQSKHGSDTTKCKKTSSASTSKGRSNSGSNNGVRTAYRPACYRSFKCSECGSGFVRADSWRSHMRQHEKHKLAQVMNGKVDGGVFQVVNPKQPDESGKQAVETDAAFTTIQPLPAPSITSPLPSQADVNEVVQGNTEAGNSNVGQYNYVITIDNLSTVFSNPVRIQEGNDMESREEQPETVSVISGDLLNDPKSSSIPETYTLSADGDKVAAPADHNFQLTSKIDHTHHLYDLSTSEKVATNHTAFVDQSGQSTVETGSEFAAHSPSQHVQQTIYRQKIS